MRSGSLWQALEHLQPLAAVRHGYHIGGLGTTALACPLPVPYGLCPKARLRVVLGQQFGLGLGGFGKLLRQDMRNPLVVLLAGALQ